MLLIRTIGQRSEPHRIDNRSPRGWLLTSTLTVFMAASGFLVTPAAALSVREAQAVVVVLEELTSETGDTVYYDEEAAEEWYQIDDETSQRIAAAGFTRETWKDAFDQTMLGFLASIPSSEFDQMFEEFVQKIDALVELTDEQKQEATNAWRDQTNSFEQFRKRGAKYAAVVSPYESRLRKLAFQR
ncbi:hypothetical protein ABFT80_10185 [Mesorhizobium sp. SB112]|uniref:hypothetical protein n=1 Tax=Mesorhizobium sp. SB112 TaxID=3151853 RepID=UPI003265B3AD